MKNSEVSLNSAGTGGAAFVDSTNLVLDTCTFSENNGRTDGGSIFSVLSQISMSKTRFSRSVLIHIFFRCYENHLYLPKHAILVLLKFW